MLTEKFVSFLECGNIWDWRCITGNTVCQKLKTDIVFCFLAAVLFFVSGLLGLSITLKRQFAGNGDDDNAIPWYHRDHI